MKSKAGRLLIGIIFLAGLSLLLYPLVANQWNNYRQKQLLSGYEQTVSQKEEANEIDYDAELKKAVAYNEALLPSILPDSFAIAEASEEDQASNLSHHRRGGFETGRRSFGRKFSSLWGRKYTCCYLCTPWTSQCFTFYRSGSAERGRPFLDPCFK